MNTADTYVRARIDADTKKRASDALEAMGLSVSGAIRLLMLRVADEHPLPFDIKVPISGQGRPISIPKADKGSEPGINIQTQIPAISSDDSISYD